MKFQDKVHAIMAQRQMRQIDLARKSGLHESRVCRWLGGNGMPNPSQLLALADALGTSVDFLADDKQDTPPSWRSEDERCILKVAFAIGYDEAMRRLTLAPESVTPRDLDAESFEETLASLRRQMADMSQVYFIEDRATGLIKIGFTIRLGTRICTLRKDYPRIRLIAVIKGGRKDEREIHGLFHPFRVKGEWFLPSPLIYEFAAANAARGDGYGAPSTN